VSYVPWEVASPDKTGAERPQRFANLLVCEVDGPTEGRTSPAAAVVAVAKPAAYRITVDLNGARAASALRFAHLGPLLQAFGSRTDVPQARDGGYRIPPTLETAAVHLSICSPNPPP